MKDAEENMGDIELRDARLAKADYLCKLGAPLADLTYRPASNMTGTAPCDVTITSLHTPAWRLLRPLLALRLACFGASAWAVWAAVVAAVTLSKICLQAIERRQ